MTYLVAGLLLFLLPHSVRIFADGWRTQRIAGMGAGAWKGIYTLLSLAGFGLMIWGYGQARMDSPDLLSPPAWTRQVTALLMLPSFILLIAAYVPGNRIKAALGHPMILGTKTWALAHLLSNGRLADVVLFGAWLVWAVLAFRAARARDRAAGVTYPARGGFSRDTIAVLVGAALWVGFALWLHVPLIGVRPY